MATAATWKDTTSYSKSEMLGAGVPRAWTWKGTGIEVVIHRHRDCDPTAWLLTCRHLGVSCFLLGRRGQVLSVADAQHAALAEVMDRLDRMSCEVRKAMGE